MAILDARDPRRVKRLEVPPLEPAKPPKRWAGGARSDARWEAIITMRAVNNGWAVTKTNAKKAIRKLVEILDDSAADHKTRIAASRALMAADDQHRKWFEAEARRESAQDPSAALADALDLLRDLPDDSEAPTD